MSDVLMGGAASAAKGLSSMSSQSWTAAKETDPSAETGAPFAGVLRSMVEQTKALDDQATATVTGLMSGQGVDIHEAMIATQKANMAFELALQVRNKAVGAYQQMMNMQF